MSRAAATATRIEEEEDYGEYGGNKKDKKEQVIVKPGGVEILVEEQQLQVRVKRCETDEDTMIKEMSEETILKELKVALDVWKKDH